MFRRIPVLLACLPSEAYQKLVLSGQVTRDENQVRALPFFDRLYGDLDKYVKEAKIKPPPKREVELRPPNRLGIVPSFFMRREQEKKISRALGEEGKEENVAYHPLSKVKGLYVWGGVGCGKTMLMDLLYENAPQELTKKRIHFHQFMLDVQKTTHAIKYKSPEEMAQRKNVVSYNTSDDKRRTPEAEVDLFDELAQRLISNVELLCFDEVAVSDVAHAMILKRLFHAFYKIGIVVVFTSNRPPEDLYLGGLNRGGFLPFIDLVNKQCLVYELESPTDHRLTGHRTNTYLAPMSPENDAAFQKLFIDMCKAMPAKERTLRVFGRDVIVPRACGGICYFYFSEICGSDMSTADYEVIAKTFNTVFINGVPRFEYEASDVKNRFLLLIDTLYEFHCKVVIYAAVEPAQLQAGVDEARQIEGGEQRFDLLTEFERETGKRLMDTGDAAFQMDRCVSRLYEMRTKEYLESPHRYQDVNIGNTSD